MEPSNPFEFNSNRQQSADHHHERNRHRSHALCAQEPNAAHSFNSMSSSSSLSRSNASSLITGHSPFVGQPNAMSRPMSSTVNTSFFFNGSAISASSSLNSTGNTNSSAGSRTGQVRRLLQSSTIRSPTHNRMNYWTNEDQVSSCNAYSCSSPAPSLTTFFSSFPLFRNEGQLIKYNIINKKLLDAHDNDTGQGQSNKNFFFSVLYYRVIYRLDARTAGKYCLQTTVHATSLLIFLWFSVLSIMRRLLQIIQIQCLNQKTVLLRSLPCTKSSHIYPVVQDNVNYVCK